MKTVAFAAINSQQSINNQLAMPPALCLMPDASSEILDLNDFELPLFSVDSENQLGQPQTAAYKNLFD
jgi:chromate reductase